jgi:hypothetical protein
VINIIVNIIQGEQITADYLDAALINGSTEEVARSMGSICVCTRKFNDNFRMNTGMVDMAPLIIWLL